MILKSRAAIMKVIKSMKKPKCRGEICYVMFHNGGKEANSITCSRELAQSTLLLSAIMNADKGKDAGRHITS